MEKVFAITVNNVNDNATDLTLSNPAVDENLAIGSLVGMVNTVDPDAGETFTSELSAGAGDTDNGRFSISPAGELTTYAAVDFQTRNSFSIRVRSTAVLLPGEARLSFVPASSFTGAGLAYKAWKANTLPARPGDRGNASGPAFSVKAETLNVAGPTGGNMPPTIKRPTVSLGTILEDPKINAGVTVRKIIADAKITDANLSNWKGIAVTFADNSHGAWTFSLDGTRWADLGSPPPRTAQDWRRFRARDISADRPGRATPTPRNSRTP